MRLIRIRFTEDRAVHAEGAVVREFKAGQVYDLPEPSARHWLNRCAELVEPAAEPEPEPAVEPAAAEPEPEIEKPADVPARRRRTRKSG